jgi:hypothetical protein
MVEIVEVNDIAELQQYRLLWNSFLSATPGKSFFLTFDWLDTYWRHFGDEQKLRVLIAYAAGEPLGILPLCVRRESYRLSNVRVLTYPIDNWGTSYGPIGPNPAATLLAAMRHIHRTPRDWDMIELRPVADNAEAGKTARAMRCMGLFTEKREHQQSSVVEVPPGVDEFLAAKPPFMRQQCRNTLDDFLADGRAEFIRHRPAPASQGDGDPRWDLCDLCETVAPAGCQASSAHDTAHPHARLLEFLRDAHAAAARLGMLDMNVLLIDGEPAAFLYGYHTDGNITMLRADIDPSTSGNVGLALVLKSIEDSCRRGDRTIDLGPGNEMFESTLRTRTSTTYRLAYTPLGSWRSQLARLSRWTIRTWAQRAASA